jgi:hypothetical protein
VDKALSQCSLPYCAIARDAIRREYSWAGAATPTQRRTIQPQESPRKDSDVSNATSLLGNSATAVRETGRAPRRQSFITFIATWLADLTRRLGIHLFLASDEEANWRGWQTIATWGGLGRHYRDARFGSLEPTPDPRGRR